MRWYTFIPFFFSFLTMVGAMKGTTNDVLLLSAGKTPGRAAEEVHWLFGGGTRELPASFLLKDQQPPMVADLYLSGGKLGELIVKGLPFRSVANEDFPALREGIFSLELPQVKKAVRMVLIIRIDGKNAGLRDAVASIPLMVCPNTLLTQLAKRFADEATVGHSLTLSLFGEMQGLRELLRLKQVPFEDLGKDFPAKLSAGSVTVGDLPKDLPIPSLSLAPGSSLMVFHDDPDSPENITVTSRDRSIEMVIHQASPNCWAEDAKAQKLLYDIIQKTPSIL